MLKEFFFERYTVQIPSLYFKRKKKNPPLAVANPMASNFNYKYMQWGHWGSLISSKSDKSSQDVNCVEDGL
jgi:hypothetical protein